MIRLIFAALAALLSFPATAQTIGDAIRGEYLVRGPAGCGNCHTPIGPNGLEMDKELGGRLVEDSRMFTAVAPNITPGSRVADWTDKQLARAIREGLRPDGSVIGPPMPYAMYRGLGDQDLADIVAFLRTLPAIDNNPGVSVYRIPLPPNYGPMITSVKAPPRSVTAAYGAYLAGPVTHCMECHTPLGPDGPMLGGDLGRGGVEFTGPWGTSVASNITNHIDGLQGYTDDQIRDMITKGVNASGDPMLPPMPYSFLERMTADDLSAIVLYLRNLPPLSDPD